MYREKQDWVFIGLVILFVIAVGVLVYYYLIDEVNVCTSDPLKYTANKVADSYGKNYTGVFFELYDDNHLSFGRREINIIE